MTLAPAHPDDAAAMPNTPAAALPNTPAAALPNTPAAALQSIPRARGPLRLLVVDAHPIVRWALVNVADGHRDLTTVGEAASTADALALTYALRPDVVTIECSAPDGDGWELAAKLRAEYPHLGIVILTADDSDRMLFRALNLGASAFVPKSAAVADVLAAIQHAGLAPESFTASGLAAALRRRQQPQEQVSLSARERQILVLLHDGLSVPAVAAQLFVSLSTAKTYVARLYDKLGARNRAQALMTAVRLGLLEDELATG